MDHKRSWYIPRPSLSSNSSSNTSKSHDSIRCYHRDSEVIDIERSKEKKSSTKNIATISSISSSASSQHFKDPAKQETCVDADCDSPKRGSRSSQGSSDSEQSIHVSINWVTYNNCIIHVSSYVERIIVTLDRSKFREFCQNSGAIASPASDIIDH